MRLEPGYRVTRRFVGRIEAAAEADLGFEFGGRITELLVEEGDAVPAGAVLARLDRTALIPERAALEAELDATATDAELAQLTLVRNHALSERGLPPGSRIVVEAPDRVAPGQVLLPQLALLSVE